MANPATLYRFKIGLSDIDRGVYEDLDFRAAMHPSETEAYLLTRVLAYALNYERGIEFSPGLCTGEIPALQIPGEHGQIALWIDIGNPSARKLHRAAKSAARVKVYTYKDPENLRRECARESVHRAKEIEVVGFSERELDSIARGLKRENAWSLISQSGGVTLVIGTESVVLSISVGPLG